MYINASLIREARMIYQHLFGRPPGQKKAQSGSMLFPTLKCGLCIVVRNKKAQEAITIVDGNAVCHEHMHYVVGGEFSIISARVQRDENNRKAGAR